MDPSFTHLWEHSALQNTRPHALGPAGKILICQQGQLPLLGYYLDFWEAVSKFTRKSMPFNYYYFFFWDET